MLKNKVQIRFLTAKADDVPFLLLLRQRTMNQHLSLAGFRTDDSYHLERIREAYNDSLIIYLNNVKVGLIKVSKQVNKFHIRQLQILPEYQSKGIGSKVLSMVISKAQALALPITLSVLRQNQAKSLYLKSGFQVIGETELEYKMQFSP